MKLFKGICAAIWLIMSLYLFWDLYRYWEVLHPPDVPAAWAAGYKAALIVFVMASVMFGKGVMLILEAFKKSDLKDPDSN